MQIAKFIVSNKYFVLFSSKEECLHACQIFPNVSGSLSLETCLYALSWLIVPLWMRVAQHVFQGRQVAKISQKVGMDETLVSKVLVLHFFFLRVVRRWVF